MIYIEPFGGLANRMRVIASGLWLKEKMKTELTIIWKQTDELNCPFNELFQSSELFKVRSKKRFEYQIKSSYGNLKTQLVNKLLGIDLCLTDSDLHQHVFSGDADILGLVKTKKNIYIQTCQDFSKSKSYYQYLLPTDSLKKRIDKTVEKFNNYTVGIHIRRTDNEMSIQNSPLQLFVDKMLAEKIVNPLSTFFLCTDDPSVEEVIVGRFGKDIIVNTQIRDRKSISGMQDALIDLYCLANAPKIFGSYWSSFSEIAAKIYNSQLFTLKKNHQLDSNDNPFLH